MLEAYLTKNSFRKQLIQTSPNHNLGIIVVVPVHDEHDLRPTLNSLLSCESPQCEFELILVFNASANAEDKIIETNKKTVADCLAWFDSVHHPNFRMHIIEENSLPHKHAGVGLARKIGMDEAVRRFNSVQNNEGIIVCYDADSQCDPNYLVEIESHFLNHPKTAATSIYFEHPTKGNEFLPEFYHGIYWYELHLRYYKNGLKYAGLPYAYHSIGSSMAVRVKDYCKQGGMNRRKAGEDFYFLQKFIDVGQLSEINSTRVIPSPRASHRVPFGTGRAIQEMLDEQRVIEKSYAIESFEIIKDCFKNVKSWYDSKAEFNNSLIQFVGADRLKLKLVEIKKQSTTRELFIKRFFQWFNAFQTLKFIHFLRDEGLELQQLNLEVPKLLNRLNVDIEKSDLLETMRTLDRQA